MCLNTSSTKLQELPSSQGPKVWCLLPLSHTCSLVLVVLWPATFKVHPVVQAPVFLSCWCLNQGKFHCMDNTTFYLSIHSCVSISVVSSFLLLWVILLWIFICRFLCRDVFSSAGCVPRSDIAASYRNLMFRILREKQTVSHSSCTVFHFCLECAKR